MISLGAIFEIKAINAAGLLPGVHLGYLMCDTCSYASKALQSVEHMLSIHHSPTAICGNMDFRPTVKIFLGALHSEVAITVSRLLNVYMVPLVREKKIILIIHLWLLIALLEKSQLLNICDKHNFSQIMHPQHFKTYFWRLILTNQVPLFWMHYGKDQLVQMWHLNVDP